MKFKKILAAALAATMIAGCSSGTSNGGSDSGNGATETATISANEALQNINVRAALSLATDRDTIATAVLKDGSVGQEGFIPKQFAYGPDGKDYRETAGVMLSYDTAKAAEYWQKAKEELGIDTLEIELLYEDSEASGKVADAIRDMWQNALDGLTVNLVSVPKKERLALMNALDYEIGLTRWGPDYADPQTYLDLYKSDVAGYNGYYFNDEYDALLNKAETGEDATDPEARWADMIAAEQMLLDDFAIIPVYQNGGAFLINPAVSGIEFHNAGVDSYRHIKRSDDGDSVTIAITADLNTMDYQVATDGQSFIMHALAVGGLVELDAEAQPVPDLAESWDISDDGLVYTFHLRDGIKWSNGEPVTADDFVFAWRRLVDPALASEYNFIVETIGVHNASGCMSGELPLEDLGVEAVDAKTFRVTLDQPSGFMLGLMAFPSFYPLNQAFFEAEGDSYALSPSDLLYCGPYILTSGSSGDGEYIFTKNPDYWNAAGQADCVDEIIFKLAQDTATAALNWESGEFDVTTLDGDLVDKYSSYDGFTTRLQGYAWRLNLNVTVK